jgi:RNA polymerase-binding transcription factor DksA
MKAKSDTKRPMTDEELAAAKQALLDRKNTLWDVISEDIEDDAREEYQDLIQSARDGSDRALAEMEETTVFSYVRLKVKEIESIDEALRRIKDGRYGRCRECSQWIRPERLKAVPSATRCRACQEKQEKQMRSE